MIDELMIHQARQGSKATMDRLFALFLSEDYYLAEAASDSFYQVGRRAVRPLIALLKDREAPRIARILAARSLNQVGGREGKAQQIEVLEDSTEDVELRRALADYLGKYGDERTFEPLLSIVLDHAADGELRRTAVAGLGSLLDRRAIAPLLDLALKKGENPELRMAALRALDQLGGANRYLVYGPGKVERPPRRFRNPIPVLRPPNGTRYQDSTASISLFGVRADAKLSSGLDLASLARYYDEQLEQAHWRKFTEDLGNAQVRSVWTFKSKWFLHGHGSLRISRQPQQPVLYHLELRADWLPALRFNLNLIDKPFDDEDDDNSAQ